jgi:mono/diheme cytochrome c family protein
VKLAFAEDEAVRALARAAWPEWAKEPEPPRAAPLTAEEKGLYERGRRQFAASCAACHQRSGLGMDGKAPPLVDSEWVLGSPDRLVRIVLNGVIGPIHVDGKLYGGFEMPAVLNMSSEEIAETLTFIRREWGHQAGAVGVDAVRRVKREVEDREEPWTEKELLKIK